MSTYGVPGFSRAASTSRADGPGVSSNPTARRRRARWPVTLEEVLVAYAGWNCTRRDRFPGGDVLGELLRDVGLPGSRRAVEDELAPVAQQVDALLQPRPGPRARRASWSVASGRFGNRGGRRQRLRVARRRAGHRIERSASSLGEIDERWLDWEPRLQGTRCRSAKSTGAVALTHVDGPADRGPIVVGWATYTAVPVDPAYVDLAFGRRHGDVVDQPCGSGRRVELGELLPGAALYDNASSRSSTIAVQGRHERSAGIDRAQVGRGKAARTLLASQWRTTLTPDDARAAHQPSTPARRVVDFDLPQQLHAGRPRRRRCSGSARPRAHRTPRPRADEQRLRVVGAGRDRQANSGDDAAVALQHLGARLGRPSLRASELPDR